MLLSHVVQTLPSKAEQNLQPVTKQTMQVWASEKSNPAAQVVQVVRLAQSMQLAKVHFTQRLLERK